jgi:bifunctional non-homologous end joining protein LigD
VRWGAYDFADGEVAMTDRLATYRKKRDFAQTPEPQGASGRRAARALRFVVQKHAARRLHYDFRLELSGTLRSWAVPKGPSFDPGVKRLAVQVEDHPLDYADFEGVIPAGQYGGGTVLVWDTGTWTPIGKDPEGDLKAGALKFELQGKKLRGAWALVRMGGKRGDKNWLLLKEKDAAAKPGSGDAITAKRRKSVISGRDLAQIAKARDRVWQSNREEGKASAVDPAAIAGARRGALAKKPAPELASLVAAVPEGEGWLHEIKFDGYRMLARIAGGDVTLLSRNGLDWTDRFPQVVAALARLGLGAAVLDGEIVHLRPDGVSSFAALKDDLSRGDTSAAVYMLFDLIHLEGFDLSGAPLDARKRALAQLLAGTGNGVLRFSEHIEGRGEDFYGSACRMGLEGIISKRADAPYRSGRSKAWLKVKCQTREELVVIGWTDPAGKRQGFGSLLLGYYDAEGALHFAGGVGTGFDEGALRALRRQLDRLAVKAPPSAAIARAAPRRAHWVKPELVAELRFSEWTEDGRLRHPVFLALREDKTAREVVRDPRAGTALPADPPRPAAAAPRSTAEIAGVRLSNADKVLYPEDGITKLDLARYYEAVAAYVLPELAGRPLTLLRGPEGYRGNSFFQKHATNAVPKTLRRIEIPEKEGTSIYLVADDLPALLSLVQMGVLEIHVWGAREPQLEKPDRVVFDFDPDTGLAWERVSEAALALRRRFEEIGLESFVKATGGKGLHVVLPLRPSLYWDGIKAFAKAMAQELAERHPTAFTTSLAKKARSGRIFIDYLRNQRGATAIAAYSTRARAHAPVAAPLSWEEVASGIRSDAFTVATMGERLRRQKRDPWHGIAEVKQSLPAALLRKLKVA